MKGELEGMADDTRAVDLVREGGERAPAGEQPAPAAAQLTPAESWSQVPAIFGRVLGRFFPEINAIYTEQANMEWGAAMVPIAERYGWTADKFLEWLGPWFMLAMASEQLATPTFQALAARVRAAKEQAAQQAAPKAEEKPAQQ